MMKHFLALPALLRAASILAAASQHSFSVQDDLLAFPQYEIRFEDEWTSEQTAQLKLSENEESRLRSQDGRNILHDASSSQVEQYKHHGWPSTDGSTEEDPVVYEQMVLDGQPWLCRIPQVKKPMETASVNETLSKAEEEKELARATDRGWELLSGMQGNCVFFISGWWSYRFCYNQGVKQFHQLPQGRGVPPYPPIEDPAVPGFLLGSYDKRLDDEDGAQDGLWESESAVEKSEGAKRRRGGQGELVQRGESRYLVQKLGGGTLCDLTGKERRIEVQVRPPRNASHTLADRDQFHCNPQSADRISLIKETSTCAYLLVIQTPRLCNDVAFLPPQKDHANPISCSPILRDDEVDEYERDLKDLRSAERDTNIWDATAEAAAAMGGPEYDQATLRPVGDVYVGEHRLVPEGHKIEKSAIVGGGKETYIETVASSDGKVLSQQDLDKLGLGDARAVEKLRKELEKIAEGQKWKLDVIDTPRGKEYRGIIGDDEEEKKSTEGAGKQAQKENQKEDDDQRRGGSEEEYYKEEL